MRICATVAAVATTFVLGMSWPALALADPAVTHFLNIPSQDLGSALKALGAAANEQVLFSKDVVAGLRSTEVKGEYTTEAAVLILLTGSGLQADRTTSGVLLIRDPKSSTLKEEETKTAKPTAGSPHSETLRLSQAESAAAADTAASTAATVEKTSEGNGATGAEGSDTSEPTEVVVTGTRIRGVAPVGSALITVDRVAMAESGLTSTNAILNSIPSVLSLGNGSNIAAGTQVQNGFSGTYGNSPNIHGLGPGATLSLVNGHRMFSEGIVSNAFDPNNFPMQMIARIEVVQDGTSPIYGADAVAGTINYVLRSPIDTLETYGGTTWSNGVSNWFGTGILGQTWGEGAHHGGFIASYQYSEQGAMRALAYPDLYNDNFSSYGGSPSPSFASPGNVLLGGMTYAVPFGQDGENLQLSQLGAAGSVNRQNAWTGLQAIPQQTSNRVGLNFNQNLTDSVQLFGDGLYSRRTFSRLSNGTSNNLAVAVPNSNPFSPCNPGHYAGGVVSGPAELLAACATGSLRVNYSSLSLVGPRVNTGLSELWEGTAGVHIGLPADWKLTLQGTAASHLQNTGTSTLSTPNAGTFNFFCDDTAFDCNPSGAQRQIPWVAGVGVNGPILELFRYYQLNADGALFNLPGGAVRLASGLEYDHITHEQHNGTSYEVSRNAKSGYAELYIPLVGAGNAVPGIHRLELDLAGRIDDYTDTGTTTNPKIGFNWSPLADLRIHGSYGKSFHPAPVMDLGSLNPIWNSMPLAASAISPVLCPLCTDPALFGPNGANKLVYNEAMGAETNLVPETSKSFSFGADWSPGARPGLLASVNYWWIKYINQVGNPQNNAGPAGQINQQYYNAHIIYNPTFFPTLALDNPLAYFEPNPHANLSDPNCAAVVGKRVNTQALFDQFARCASNSSLGPAHAGGQTLNGPVAGSSNDLLAFGYFGQQNAGYTSANGLDLSASYGWDSTWGAWKVGAIGEYVRRFEVSVIPGAPVIDEVNRFGYPLRVKGRGQLNWSRGYTFGSLSTTLFVNYSNAYKLDMSLLAPGVPGAYASIDSHTTADLTLIYSTRKALSSWLVQDVTIALSAQNIFNSTAPLVINPAGGGGPGILFDPPNAFPLSRVVQLQIGKSW